MIASQKSPFGGRSPAAIIHDLDKNRSKWGLTVVLVCVTFWLALFSLFRAFF